jgi:hypothetical protein
VAHAEAGGAVGPATTLALAPGDRLGIGLDTAAADAPLGLLAISVDAAEQAGEPAA